MEALAAPDRTVGQANQAIKTTAKQGGDIMWVKLLVLLANPVVVTILMVLVALVTTVVLYTLFDNYAVFENTTKGIKLGGSVAFFFILFITEFFIYQNLQCDKLLPIREAIAGKWTGISTITSSEHSETTIYRSNVTIQIGPQGKITLIGNIEGRQETWVADEVVLTGSKLVYFYEVPMLSLTGVTNLHFSYNNESKLTEMKGYWILAGQQGKGNITFKRDD